MSPRRMRRSPEERPEPRVYGTERVEEWSDGEWVVRSLTGSASGKAYRCPGCDQEIRPGTPHTVSWPNWAGGEAERRHWHNPCWRNRLRLGPGRSRY
ncbi:ATP/GTP-binding protein [Bailinhaonella thermotolerans]|uniref:ATP/GTP-binding protein n=1 Tax=Bailinhaonella thermotolerans TaxID=1070861 RepID=A0A3A4A930_9ACTN|nr:ATP/GTP-binding protein [Bailinhaonella thermotolerans]RJL24519.1 ATP/GTP-binding protein [Bailinhaonella thermotolerans]